MYLEIHFYFGTVACACLDTSRLATLAEPSTRHGTTKQKMKIQIRAMRSRPLNRSDDLISIEYSDNSFDKCVIQVFSKTARAAEIILYPTLDPCASYSYNGETVTSKEIAEDGIRIDLLKANSCRVIRLDKV